MARTTLATWPAAAFRAIGPNGQSSSSCADCGLTKIEICQAYSYAPFSADLRRLDERTFARNSRAHGLGPRPRLHGHVRLLRARRRGGTIATIQAALDAGITLLDTGDYYAAGHDQVLIREALRSRQREQAVISVKFGLMRGLDGQIVGKDLRLRAVKNFLAYTLRRLGTDYVDVYRPGRVSPDVPVEETVGAIAEMVEAGYVSSSASPRSVPRRSAGRTPCFPSQTCRSSTR